MNSTKLGLIVVYLLTIVVLVASVYSETAPPLPTLYWGYVTKDNQPQNGVYVEAYTENGLLVGKDTKGTRNDEQGNDGMYSLDILWDNPETPAVEGITKGETILFKINDKIVKKVIVGEKGDTYRIDLDADATTATGGGGSSAGIGIVSSKAETPTNEDTKKDSEPTKSPDEISPEGEQKLSDANVPTANTVIQGVQPVVKQEKNNTWVVIVITTIIITIVAAAVIAYIFYRMQKKSQS